MVEVSVRKVIQVHPEKVWGKIKAFDDIDKILPPIATCEVSGSGPGATRICTFEDGGKLFERLDSIDEKEKKLTYSITEGSIPVTEYVGTITVFQSGEEQCEVEWTARFKAPLESQAEMKSMVEGVYAMGIEGLEKLLGSPSIA